MTQGKNAYLSGYYNASSSPGFSNGNWAPNANGSNAGHYAGIGSGGYTGTLMPIRDNNANNTNNDTANRRQRNPDLADNGDARTSKVVGTSVYNDQNQQVGSIDDLLIGRNGVWAVVSTGK